MFLVTILSVLLFVVLLESSSELVLGSWSLDMLCELFRFLRRQLNRPQHSTSDTGENNVNIPLLVLELFDSLWNFLLPKEVSSSDGCSNPLLSEREK